jgi:hypothetical protein
MVDAKRIRPGVVTAARVAAGAATRAIASSGALIAAAGISSFHWPEVPLAKWLPVVALVMSALLVHMRHLGGQLFVRGLWFSTALLCSLNLLYGPSYESTISFAVVASCVVSLLAIGRQRLADDGDDRASFRPHAFRSALLVALGVAGADALSLAFYGLVYFEAFQHVSILLPLAASLGLSAFGLYRMRTWALLLAGGSAMTVGTLAVTGSLPVPGPLVPIYAVSALVQLAALFPMLRLAARRLARDSTTATTEQAFERVRIATPSFQHRDTAASTAADADEEARAVEESVGASRRESRGIGR